MTLTEPTELRSGLDYLSTLAPHRVRATPVVLYGKGIDPNSDTAPMQFQFRASDDARWDDHALPALAALEQELGMVHRVLSTTHNSVTVALLRPGQPLDKATHRNAPSLLTARVLVLVAVLIEELQRCAP